MIDTSQALDHEGLEQRVLARIGSKLQDILPEGVFLNAVSCTPDGYTVILATLDGMQKHGVLFARPPTARQLHQTIAGCVKVFRKGARA